MNVKQGISRINETPLAPVELPAPQVNSTLRLIAVSSAIEPHAQRERSVRAIGVHIVDQAAARAVIEEEDFQEEVVEVLGEAGADAEG